MRMSSGRKPKPEDEEYQESKIRIRDGKRIEVWDYRRC